MRIDLVLPNEGDYGLEAVKVAPQIEDMGYQGLWLTDHVVGFDAYKPVYGEYWLEILGTLHYIAATTNTIRLGLGVLVIPYREPVYVAKSLATLDVLSNGRVDLGVGVGWCKSEYYALGRESFFKQRGAYTNEALDVMQLCWNADDSELDFQGQFTNFRNMQFAPKPVQPSIPLWVGALGTATAPLKRAAKYADVWHPANIAPEEVKEGSARLNEMAGREIPASIRTSVPKGASMAEIVDLLGNYREAGCIQAAVDLKAPSFDSFIKQAEQLSQVFKDL